MNSQEIWNQVQKYTELTSQHARTLGFAAAGLYWLQRGPTGELAPWTRYGLGFVVLFFCLDLVQYAFAAVRYRRWIRSEEVKRWKEERQIGGEYDVPESLDRPVYGFWWAKLISLTLAFGILATILFSVQK